MVRLKLRSHVGLQATVVNSDGTVLATGGFPVFGVGLRAGISPLHAVPLVASGAADALALSTEELAVACRVRNASGPLHRAIISSMLGKAGVPIAETHRETQGALASMLATCHYLGWDCSTCLASHHPLQRWIGTIVSASYGLPTAGVKPAYPVGPPLTVPASTDQGALAAAMLADPGGAIWEGLASAGPAVARLRDAILSRPELVTGGQRDRDDHRLCDRWRGSGTSLRAKPAVPGGTPCSRRHRRWGHGRVTTTGDRGRDLGAGPARAG